MTDFYPFGLAGTKHKETSKEVLGGKGAGLVWMSAQGLSVPPGFVIPTTVWEEYDLNVTSTLKAIAKALPKYMGMLNKHFGYTPLVSVRSGARTSCPGMMETILNVGLDDETAPFWKGILGQLCYEKCTQKLVVMYGSIVDGLDKKKLAEGTYKDSLQSYEDQAGHPFPRAEAQLLSAVEAVLNSWDSERNNIYRKEHGIPREWGTAVTIQAMVYGNLNSQSATGVLFTRNPATGEPKVKGEWLVNAQGEDIVAGIRTPDPLETMATWNSSVYVELMETVHKLETAKKDMQDVEFTIQDGTLFLLQHRAGKRTASAALRIAMDLLKEGVVTRGEAFKLVSPADYDRAQVPQVAASFKTPPTFKGLSGSPGVVSGKPVFSSVDAINCTVPCILVTEETTPDDIGGMHAAKGVLTMTGGFTCHAAVVARESNVPCVVGLGQKLKAFKGVEEISIDGATGSVWLERVPIEVQAGDGVVREFTELVYETVGALPIIYDIPAHPLTQALYVVGTALLNPTETAAKVLEIAGKVGRLYVECDSVEESERKFFSILAGSKLVTNFIQALEAVASDKKDSIVLVSARPSSVFTSITEVSSFAELVLADKEAVIWDFWTDWDSKAVEKLIGWKKAEGVSFVRFGQSVPGFKSFVSIQAALQTVGKGA